MVCCSPQLPRSHLLGLSQTPTLPSQAPFLGLREMNEMNETAHVRCPTGDVGMGGAAGSVSGRGGEAQGRRPEIYRKALQAPLWHSEMQLTMSWPPEQKGEPPPREMGNWCQAEGQPLKEVSSTQRLTIGPSQRSACCELTARGNSTSLEK